MRTLLIKLTALLAASGLAAAAPSAIRGRVFDSATDAPIESATVRLLRQPGKTLAAEVSTDRTGQFVFENPQRGTYLLTAEKPLYVDLLPSGAPSKTAQAPGADEPVTLYLTRTVVIAGRIADPSGRPPRGVRVQAMARRADRSGARLAAQGGAVQPGPNGEFRLFGLPPDRYTLAVIPPTGMEGSGSAPVYFPGVTDPARAEFFSLAAGESRLDVNLTIDTPLLYAVAGTVAGIPPEMAGRVAVSVLATGIPLAVRHGDGGSRRPLSARRRSLRRV